ncbi:MAG: penicillin-binding protein [Candidatus Pacebacteria bacterium]|nr:penicillin-binding protein [Candidatus Paceibacterota bacterium]MBP9772243.1 penicillin-binding protein [Candidatus Paceibacterota bacterium]
MNKLHINHKKRSILFITATFFVLFCSIGAIWLSSIELPDFKSFEERKIARSTKIYDRTGEILLYDVHQDFRRTVIPYEQMGENVKNATIAIEDSSFYEHNGIRPTSIIRAVIANIFSGNFSQGGSTITQQVIKNTLLTTEKTITRKFKEWILAIKLDGVMSKDEILAVYLNDAPYGGSIYGVQEASKTFFNKNPIDLTLAEAAYLAAIPKAPTYYSPFGQHRDKLDARKNTVLSRMLEIGMIDETAYQTAKEEVVEFKISEGKGIKAPHFVFFIKEYLEEQYGQDIVENGGLKVITTLDYSLQEQAEEIVKRNALKNEIDWNASNASMVAIDPKTGQILVMVGSRDYFDKEIDGNFNIATAQRQPGSSFKPFVYATALKEGYTANTVLFDVPTEFQGGCNAYGVALSGNSQSDCYSPDNYDGKYVGPINLRNSLGQSRNVTSVKLLYLAGVQDSITTARTMGITTLTNASVYGLTLVLGGGEVSLLDMVSSYGVFANEGIRNPYNGILKIEDHDGQVLEEFKENPTSALDSNVALTISDILADNVARTPLFGSNSFMVFPGYEVAAKTGTTNNNKDAWLVGYTPSIVVGVWSGNNDNTPMKKGSSISGPMWHEFMNIALKAIPQEDFEKPIIENDPSVLKPILRGEWMGGESYIIDTISGKLATEFTPQETRKELVVTNVHDILHWVNKTNPRGPIPENPSDDSQYIRWETTVQDWWIKNKYLYNSVSIDEIPTTYDNIHTEKNIPEASFINPKNGVQYSQTLPLSVSLDYKGNYSFQKFDIFIDNIFLGSSTTKDFTFIPSENNISKGNHNLRVVVYDTVYNKQDLSISLDIN